VSRNRWSYESTASCGLRSELPSPRARAERAGEPPILFRRRSVLRTGRIFDTPPLGRALQSAVSALGLLVEFKPLPKLRALCGALGLPKQEIVVLADPTNTLGEGENGNAR
jgi:hypothetical protein